MNLRTFLIFVYLVTSIPLFLFFYTDISVWLSFFVNYLFITAITYFHLEVEKTYSPFLSAYIVFNFLFFIVAPIIQINAIDPEVNTFINFFPYSSNVVIYTNAVILFFNIIFFLSYVHFKSKRVFIKALPKSPSPFTPIIAITLVIICAVILITNFGFLINEIERANWMKPDTSVGSLLIRKKVLFLVPLGGVAICFSYLRSKVKLSRNSIIIFGVMLIMLFILLVLKNPLTEKRNALGPIYISLIYLFFPKIINKNAKSFLFLFISMIIAFPLISALTHLRITFQEMIEHPEEIVEYLQKEGILRAFSTLHYDAYANIIATVDYVKLNGLEYGHQLLSSLLFFIPRGIWEGKPYSTGQVVGDHLIEEYGFRFNNISNPIVSEGYINFGWVGVFLMAIALSFAIIKLMQWLNSGDALKEIISFYFAIHLLFLLRGDFTNGYAYFIGTLLGVVVIPKIIEKCITFSFSKSKTSS
jgi:hypothetical protein